MRVRRLARGLQHAERVAIEGRAERREIVDPRPRFQRDAERDVGVDKSGAGGDGVGGVNLRVSPSETAAATPPCAQAEAPPIPAGPGLSRAMARV